MRNKFFAILIAIFGLMAFNVETAEAQRMYFCENVDSDGEPIRSATVFNIPSAGGYLYVLVQNDKALKCTGVRFEIYRNGKYENTINMNIEPNWDYFYQQVTFYKSGKYDVYAYDANDRKIASSSVKINYK